MWKDITTYYNGYTPTADQMTMTICIVLFLLIKVTYVNKSRSFHIFQNTIFMLFGTAFLRVLYYYLLNRLSLGSPVSIPLLKLLYCAYHTGSCMILFSFMRYLTEPLQIDKRIAAGHIRLLGVLILLMISHMYFNAFYKNGVGLKIYWDNGCLSVNEGINLFMACYVVSIVLILFMIYYYRKRIYSQIIIGLVGAGTISIIINVVQYYNHQDSLTVSTFLFPIFAIFFLIHANPYDIEIGTMNAKAFQNMIYHARNKQILLIQYYMHNLEKNGSEYPKNLRSNLRDLFSDHFKSTTMFQISTGRIVFAADMGKNEVYDVILDDFLAAADKLFKEQNCDYKAIAMMNRKDIVLSLDYLNIMRFVGARMKENTYRIAYSVEIDQYLEQRKIIMLLDDIAKKRDYDDERILVYCQPVYNIGSGKYDTAEALMRIQTEDGILLPGQFIPLAEKNDTIYPLGLIILNKVCKQIRKFLDEGYSITRISVNFSIQDFKQEHFCDDIQLIVAKSGIPFDKIALEITETQNEYEFMLVKQKMLELKHSGIKFYLDDFGTGYSNYERIMELPFDIIKFDRSLVMACGLNRKSEKMVESMAKMFASMDYSILYEGVETEDDILRCKNMNGEYLQGFHYSKPVPIEEMNQYFELSQKANGCP